MFHCLPCELREIIISHWYDADLKNRLDLYPQFVTDGFIKFLDKAEECELAFIKDNFKKLNHSHEHTQKLLRKRGMSHSTLYIPSNKDGFEDRLLVDNYASYLEYLSCLFTGKKLYEFDYGNLWGMLGIDGNSMTERYLREYTGRKIFEDFGNMLEEYENQVRPICF